MDENKKSEVNKIRRQKLQEEEKKKLEQYNPNDLFKKIEKQKTLENSTSTALIEYKESIFTKFKNFVFKLLHIKQ